MNIAEILLIILLAALLLWAAWRSIQKARRGGGCCGEFEEAAARITVRDRNKAHYPFQLTLNIGGMTCENCARKVENALNELDGVWAEVRISNHQALVRTKKEPDTEALCRAVQNAGYVVMSH